MAGGAQCAKHVVMGRIFETRKATMFARWNKMAKAFTRVSKEIVGQLAQRVRQARLVDGHPALVGQARQVVARRIRS